jgi:hypothetical protein
VFLDAINWINPAGLGFGDVRLGALIGLAPGLARMGLRRLRASPGRQRRHCNRSGSPRTGPSRAQDAPLPFGVFLAHDAAAAILVSGL